MHNYNTTNINIVADRDHVEQVSYLVNDGYIGLSERIKYKKKIKRGF